MRAPGLAWRWVRRADRRLRIVAAGLCALGWLPVSLAGATTEPDLAPRKGEIRLEGIVGATDDDEGGLKLYVYGYTLPGGKTGKLKRPNVRRVRITTGTVLVHADRPRVRLTRGDLRAYIAVTVVGPHLGSGAEVPARAILQKSSRAPGWKGPLAVPGQTVVEVAWSPDGKRIAAAYTAPSEAGVPLIPEPMCQVRIWDLEQAEVRAVLPGEFYKALAWHPDGTALAVMDAAREVRLWDVTAGRFSRKFPAPRVGFGLAWSPDGKTLAAGGRGSSFSRIDLWDVATGTRRELASPRGRSSGGFSGKRRVGLIWSPDGRALASTDLFEANLYLWDPARGVLRHKLPNPWKENPPARSLTAQVHAWAWSPDGKTLAAVYSGSYFSRVPNAERTPLTPRTVLWEVATGRNRKSLLTPGVDYPEMAAWSADGEILATGRYHRPIFLWNTKTWTIERELETPPGADRDGTLAWSPDGKALAAGNYLGEIYFWHR